MSSYTRTHYLFALYMHACLYIHTYMYCMYTTCRNLYHLFYIQMTIRNLLTYNNDLYLQQVAVYKSCWCSSATLHLISEFSVIVLLFQVSVFPCSCVIYWDESVIYTVLLCSGIAQLEMFTFASFHLLFLWGLIIIFSTIFVAVAMNQLQSLPCHFSSVSNWKCMKICPFLYDDDDDHVFFFQGRL